MVMATDVCENLEYENFQSTPFAKRTQEAQQAATNLKQHSTSLQCRIPIDWCTAVFVLKAVLRRQIPLSTNEVFINSTSTSDNESAAPSTGSNAKLDFSLFEGLLQHVVKLLRFLAKNDKNATSSGLAIILTSSESEIEANAKFENTASQKLSKLLHACYVIGERIRAQQTYISMTTSPMSQHLKPARIAPPIPKQSRPLPPPPVPEHAINDAIAPVVTSSPSVPIRSESLMCSVFNSGDRLFRLSDSSVFLCTSEDEFSDAEPSPGNRIVNNTISHVVCRRLFNAEFSPKDTWVARTTTPSLRHKHDGSTIRTSTTVNFSEEQISGDTELMINPPVHTSSGTIVTTPDSGCGTAEDDSSHIISIAENREPIFIPKLNLEAAIEEDPLFDVRETVPPLDLSEISPPDEDTRNFTPSRKDIYDKPRRRRKSAQSSPNQVRYSPPKPSSPIDIPAIHLSDSHDTDDDVTDDVSPTDGSLRWRDVWSTDEDIIPMQSAMEYMVKRNVKYSVEEDSFEQAPSSPESHLPHRHPQHHHHHHHKRHHHHDNHLSRLKLSNSLRQEAENCDHIFVSLQSMLNALDEHRKETARPEDLTLMTREQIRLEKAAMQRELLKHENRYGRPSTKEEKEIMRSVYERYRTVKRLLADTMSPPFSSTHRRFDNFEYEINTSQQADDFAVTQLVTLAPPDGKCRLPEYKIEANDHISGDVGITELRKQHREAKGKRKRLRRKLQEFEKEFEQQYGRPVNQSDRILMADEYREYHGLKLKLRLLDALIEKHNAQFR